MAVGRMRSSCFRLVRLNCQEQLAYANSKVAEYHSFTPSASQRYVEVALVSIGKSPGAIGAVGLYGFLGVLEPASGYSTGRLRTVRAPAFATIAIKQRM